MNLARNVLMVALALFPLGCAIAPSSDEIAAQSTAMLKASFKATGQAGLDRLNQDETQRVCSELPPGKAPAKEVAEKIEKMNLATIRYPADGKLLGDWKNGEKIAQEGRGKQVPTLIAGRWARTATVTSARAAGISCGTIGPAFSFAKLRGTGQTRSVTPRQDIHAEALPPVRRCRGAHNSILTEQQIKV